MNKALGGSRIVESYRTCNILDWFFATVHVEKRLVIQFSTFYLIKIYCLIKNPNDVDQRRPVRGDGGRIRFCLHKKVRSGRLDDKFANERFARHKILHF